MTQMRRDAAEQWERYDPGVELVVVESPYRRFIGPLLRYSTL